MLLLKKLQPNSKSWFSRAMVELKGVFITSSSRDYWF
jgi:hypothetical protein